jgi:hypothetical protein
MATLGSGASRVAEFGSAQAKVERGISINVEGRDIESVTLTECFYRLDLALQLAAERLDFALMIGVKRVESGLVFFLVGWGPGRGVPAILTFLGAEKDGSALCIPFYLANYAA